MINTGRFFPIPYGHRRAQQVISTTQGGYISWYMDRPPPTIAYPPICAQTKVCPQCIEERRIDEKFCYKCGERLKIKET